MRTDDVLISAVDELNLALKPLRFGAPVTHVYNPLVYARHAHETYVRKYGATQKRVVFLGMNPGPFGMAQTGVPFGEVSLVRDWLGIEVAVDKPKHEHPKRPIEGFACKRSEVSGARLWGAFKARFETPERFFERSFVVNYCPLVFMEESARNVTPDKLPRHERDPLFAACDAHLRRVICALDPVWVIGVGAFACTRAELALQGLKVNVGTILHPSPASPLANAGWEDKAFAQLAELSALRELGLSKRS